jgi:hypothetical protein
MARDVSNRWTLAQSNGPRVEFDIVQDSNGNLHGSGKVISGGGGKRKRTVEAKSTIFRSCIRLTGITMVEVVGILAPSVLMGA